MKNTAVFLDRDGVLIHDVHLLTREDQVEILPGVPESIALLRSFGFKILVVTNQTVVSRGLSSEKEVEALNKVVQKKIALFPNALIDAFYVCPHHPDATLELYRRDCDCRKPKPGLLIRGAKEHNVDTNLSFSVGDRITDAIAGARVGCRTVLVETGRHLEAPIQTTEILDKGIRPDFICRDLKAAVNWILKSQ